MKIKTIFNYPPIPRRLFDWSAYIDGDEEYGPYGYGETEDDAIKDLKDQLEDVAISLKNE